MYLVPVNVAIPSLFLWDKQTLDSIHLNVLTVERNTLMDLDKIAPPATGRTTQRYFTLNQLVEDFPTIEGRYNPDVCSLILSEHHLPPIFMSQHKHGDYTLLGVYAHNIVFTARECIQSDDKVLARKIGKYSITAIIIEPDKYSDLMVDLYKDAGIL